MKKRVVIAGSRDFNDYKLFSSVVDNSYREFGTSMIL